MHISPCLSMVGKESDIDLTLTLDQALDFIFSHKVDKETLANIEVELTQFKPLGVPLAMAGNLMQMMVDRGVLTGTEVQYLSGLSTCIEALKKN